MSKRPRPKQSASTGYLATVRALGLALAPGSMVHLVVAHEGWCPFLRGGPCQCPPDYIVEFLDGRRN